MSFYSPSQSDSSAGAATASICELIEAIKPLYETPRSMFLMLAFPFDVLCFSRRVICQFSGGLCTVRWPRSLGIPGRLILLNIYWVSPTAGVRLMPWIDCLRRLEAEHTRRAAEETATVIEQCCLPFAEIPLYRIAQMYKGMRLQINYAFGPVTIQNRYNRVMFCLIMAIKPTEL